MGRPGSQAGAFCSLLELLHPGQKFVPLYHCALDLRGKLPGAFREGGIGNDHSPLAFVKLPAGHGVADRPAINGVFRPFVLDGDSLGALGGDGVHSIVVAPPDILHAVATALQHPAHVGFKGQSVHAVHLLNGEQPRQFQIVIARGKIGGTGSKKDHQSEDGEDGFHPMAGARVGGMGSCLRNRGEIVEGGALPPPPEGCGTNF